MEEDEMSVFEDMTPEEREALGEKLKAFGQDLIEAVKANSLSCPACHASVAVTTTGRDWVAACTCGWSAAGSGYTKPMYN